MGFGKEPAFSAGSLVYGVGGMKKYILKSVFLSD